MLGKSFFNFLAANFIIAAPLYNWRRTLVGPWNFDTFRDYFLTLTGELADTVFCAFPCAEECGKIRKIVKTPNGKLKAVCPRNENNFFYIPVEEIVVYRLNNNALTEAIVIGLMNYRGKSPEPYPLPEKTDKTEEEFPDSAYPVQNVFPFASRHIYKEIDGESEKWYVDGKLKKVYGSKKRNCLQSKILNIIYNQIGNGWIPHETFMNASGWNENKYFGKNYNNPGGMREILRRLREHLDIKINFSKKYGIKFSDEVVKVADRVA